MDEAVLADLKLAVTEACGNAVRHAHAGHAGGRSRALRDRRTRRSRSRSRTRARDRRGRPGRRPDVDDLSEGGMGLAIIRAVVDELADRRAGRRSRHRRPHAQAARPGLRPAAARCRRGRLRRRARPRASGRRSRTWSRPVISKMRRAVVSGSTTGISPPASRTRRRPPTRTPRAVESRNATPVRSSTRRRCSRPSSSSSAPVKTSRSLGASCASSSPRRVTTAASLPGSIS